VNQKSINKKSEDISGFAAKASNIEHERSKSPVEKSKKMKK
jgi:hypothetical protein